MTSALAQAAPERQRAGAAAGFGQGRLRIGNRIAQRGADADEEPRQERRRRGDAEDRQVDASAIEKRNRAGIEPDQTAYPGDRQQYARQSARSGIQHRLDQQLADEPAAARAEGAPERQFPTPRRPAREHQVGDIGAGDEQHDRDRRSKQDEREARIADHLFAERHDLDSPVRARLRVAVREFATESFSDLIQIGLGPRQRGVGPQPDHHAEILIAASVGAITRPVVRHPEIRGRLEEADGGVGEAHARRHDAGDLRPYGADDDRPPDDRGIRTEPAPPERVAHERHRRRAGRAIGLRERAAQRGRDREQREERRRDDVRDRAFRFADAAARALAAERRVLIADGRHLFERALPLADVRELGGGHRRLAEADLPVGVPDDGQPVGALVRDALEQDRVDDAEDRRARADADGNRGERGGGEQRRLARRAQRAAEILSEPLPPRAASHLDLRLLGHRRALAADVVEIAEARERPGARRLTVETGRHVASRLHLEVELELVVPFHARSTFVTAVVICPHSAVRVRNSAAALWGQRVALDVFAELGSSPLGGDPPAALHPMKRRIERSLLDAQNVGRWSLQSTARCHSHGGRRRRACGGSGGRACLAAATDGQASAIPFASRHHTA